VWKYSYINRERGISERGNNNTRMGRVLHETAGREKGRRRGGNTNEGEADGARGNRNHSGRGGKTDKDLEKEKGSGEGRGGWYGTERMVERMVELMNGVWRGEEFPVDRREGVIRPIFKKGEKNRAANYRGKTLLNTGYKLYASILSERMNREIEEKGVLPDGQAGFRKGRGTMGNVYSLDHLTRNELRKKGGRMCTLFVDFRAAFDKVEVRERERGISE
jgi:hypothetical protein